MHLYLEEEPRALFLVTTPKQDRRFLTGLVIRVTEPPDVLRLSVTGVGAHYC